MKSKSGGVEGMCEAYNSNSSPQLCIIESSMELIKKGIEILQIQPSSFPIIIADFGASHGSNSIHALKMIINYINEFNQSDRSFLIIHNDLPTNDWKTLFNLSNEQEKTYFSCANGRSFYQQCLPSNSLTVGYSSASLHWLSRKPCNISNHCISVFAQGDELQAFRKQARDDYQLFLQNRSNELIDGGILILSMNSLNEEGLTMVESIYHLLYKCAQLISFTDEELLEFTIPVYIRSQDECLDQELFHQYSLQLIQSNILAVDFKFYEQWINNQLTLKEFSQAQTGFIKSAIESLVRQTLESSEKRSKEDIDQLLKQFWTCYQEQIEQNPHDFDIKCYQTYLILKKMSK